MTGVVTAGGAGLGGLLLSPIAGWLILAYGWRTSYVIIGIIGIVFVLLLGHFLKRDPAQLGELPDGATGVKLSGVERQESTLQGEGFSFQRAIRTRQFWLLAIIFLSYGFCRGTIFVHIVAYVTDLGFSLITGSYVLAVIAAVSAVSGIAAGRLADKIGNRPTLMIGYIVTAITLFAVIIARELWMLYLFAIIFSLGRGGAEVVRFPLTSEIFGLGSIGAIIGALEFMTTIGTALGPLIAGRIFDVTGNYDLAFLACAIVATAALSMAWLLTPPKRGLP